LIKLFGSIVPGFGNTAPGLAAFVAVGSVVTAATFAAFATATFADATFADATFAATTFGAATTFDADAATFGAAAVASRALPVTLDRPAPSAACCTACACTTFVASR
jgi:hypothetical protein